MHDPDDHLSRRTFVKGTSAVGAFIALDAVGGVGLAAGREPRPTALANAVIFPDPTLCIGCLTCEVVCSQVHRQQGLADVPRIRIFNDPTVQVDPEVRAAYPGRGSFRQEPCLQCPTAECLYVCPVNAMQVEPRTGARLVREDRCVACGRCADACIFPISGETDATNQLRLGQRTRITYDPDRDTFAKCDLCYFREAGPACVERCPVNIRIRQGILKSDRLCLSAPGADRPTWDQLRSFQTFAGSPALQVASRAQPWGMLLSDNFLLARSLPFTLALGVAFGPFRALGGRADRWLAGSALIVLLITGAWQLLKALLAANSRLDMPLVYRVHYLAAALLLFVVAKFVTCRLMSHARRPPARQFRWGMVLLVLIVTGVLKAMRYIYPIPGDVLWWVSAMHVGGMLALMIEVSAQGLSLARSRRRG